MIKKFIWILVLFLSISYLFCLSAVRAEDLAPGRVIPKLAKTADDPMLLNGKVYPFWGPICQRYTYSVVYSDKDGRPPEYVKIYFNGEMLDMQKENPDDNDYKKGIKYIFQNVPDKYGSNFYYFEASNGLGKARASIIDSPDNGPVLFDSDFKNNEIVLIDPAAGKEIWRYSTGVEWIGAVALSSDGKYLTAQSSNHIYFFDTGSNIPLWIYKSPVNGNIGGDVKGGVAISADGTKIFAALNGKAIFFDYKTNKPVWSYNLEQNGGGAYGVDISRDGSYTAVAMAGSESDQNSNVLILFDQSGKKLWQYHSSGNWHEVSFSQDGSFLAGSTGCPDRRGYLFSKDSPEPLVKSEPLSKESPIDEARISADGNLAVYGVESGYGAIVLVDKNTKKIIWKYDTPQGRSVRALAMTPDGQLIGAGTFGGDILLFEKNSSIPIEQIKINSAIGAFDLSDDGSIFMTGSVDKKIRIFHKGEGRIKAEIKLNEYVGELDISSNGKYAAAGTSGAVYFFESLSNLTNVQLSTCTDIIEPPEENESLFGEQNSMNSPIQNDEKNEEGFLFFPAIISISCAVIFAAISAVYILICRIKKIKVKKVILILLSIFILLSLFAAIFFLWEGDGNYRQKTTGNNICGDSMCNPDFGETKESCPQDCTQ